MHRWKGAGEIVSLRNLHPKKTRIKISQKMSDGNFNRALLPATPYRSGIKMGQLQAKAKAIEALKVALEKADPALSDEQKEAIKANFEQELRLHL